MSGEVEIQTEYTKPEPVYGECDCGLLDLTREGFSHATECASKKVIGWRRYPTDPCPDIATRYEHNSCPTCADGPEPARVYRECRGCNGWGYMIPLAQGGERAPAPRVSGFDYSSHDRNPSAVDHEPCHGTGREFEYTSGELEIRTPLDRHTCDHCRQLEGKRVALEDGRELLEAAAHYHQAHQLLGPCRCVMALVDR